MKVFGYLGLVLFLMNFGPMSCQAQKVLVCDWEIINFPITDAQKISDMLRQELKQRWEVPSQLEMQQKLAAANLVLPLHLETNDIQRLGEIFQAPQIVTGLITRIDEEFTLNVRLIKIPEGDTLISITQNIHSTLLEPSRTIIPEIAHEIAPYLPVSKRTHQSHWKKFKWIGLSSIFGGAILTYFLWPKTPTHEVQNAKLPPPPQFP